MILLPGDFVFFHTPSLPGRVISALQKRIFGKKWSIISHVAVCVESPDVVREAEIPKVVIHSYTEVPGREVVAVARPVYLSDDYRLHKLLVKERAISGQWYGIPQIFGMLWYSLLILSGFDIKHNPVKTGRDCTEDAYYFKKDAERIFGVHSNDGLSANDIYPSQLLLSMESSPYYEIYST